MRSVGAAVVLVSMVLRAASQSEKITETTVGTTASRTCPDMSECTGNCQPDYSYLYDGCPTCLCVDPICGWLVRCGPDEDCVLNHEAIQGAVCVPKYGTTTKIMTSGSGSRSPKKPTTDTTKESITSTTLVTGMTITKVTSGSRSPTKLITDRTTESITSTIRETTTFCPVVTCAPDCVRDIGSDVCPTCACPPSCQTVKCSDGNECQLINVTCIRYPCFPQPQCVPTDVYAAANMNLPSQRKTIATLFFVFFFVLTL